MCLKGGRYVIQVPWIRHGVLGVKHFISKRDSTQKAGWWCCFSCDPEK